MIADIIWDVDPRIIPGFELLRWYGMCWVVGLLLAYKCAETIFKKEGVPIAQLDQLTFYAMIGGIIGARLGHILFYDPMYYWNHPIEILPIRLDPHFEFTGLTGLASHGGVLGVLIAVFLYRRKFQVDYLWLLDRVIIACPLLFAMIRIGNLMNSEIIGSPTSLPWAFIFVQIDTIPRHPAQVYEALSYLSTGILLFLLWKKTPYGHSKGFLFGLGTLLMAFQRFMLEFLKENQVAFEEGMSLNMGQILSIPMFLIGLTILLWSLKMVKKQSAPTDA